MKYVHDGEFLRKAGGTLMEYIHIAREELLARVVCVGLMLFLAAAAVFSPRWVYDRLK